MTKCISVWVLAIVAVVTLGSARRTSAQTLNDYSVCGVNGLTGELFNYNFATGKGKVVAKVCLASNGNAISGVKGLTYVPCCSHFYGFWTDPSTGLTSLLYIDCLTGKATPVGSSLGASTISAAAAVSLTTPASVASGKRTPLSQVSQYRLYAIQGAGSVNASTIIVLDPSKSGATTLSGNATLNVPGGAVQINSSSASALSGSGNTVIVAATTSVVGAARFSGNAKVTGTLVTGAPAQADPFASLAAPTRGADLGSRNFSGSAVTTINPGYYSGGISLSGNTVTTFTAAIYILGGAGLATSGNAIIVADGVLIYFTGSASISLSGNGNIHMTPSSSGPYAGVSIFQDRADTASGSISGNGNLDLHGSLYFPGNQLTLSGNGAGFGNQIVPKTLVVSGNGQITVQPLLATPTLVSVNTTTGATTPVATVSHTYDSITSVNPTQFYGSSGGQLYTITVNTSTQTTTETPIGSPATGTQALQYVGSTLYDFNNSNQQLTAINVITGAPLGNATTPGVSNLNTATFVRNADAPVSTTPYD